MTILNKTFYFLVGIEWRRASKAQRWLGLLGCIIIAGLLGLVAKLTWEVVMK